MNCTFSRYRLTDDGTTLSDNNEPTRARERDASSLVSRGKDIWHGAAQAGEGSTHWKEGRKEGREKRKGRKLRHPQFACTKKKYDGGTPSNFA